MAEAQHGEAAVGGRWARRGRGRFVMVTVTVTVMVVRVARCRGSRNVARGCTPALHTVGGQELGALVVLVAATEQASGVEGASSLQVALASSVAETHSRAGGASAHSRAGGVGAVHGMRYSSTERTRQGAADADRLRVRRLSGVSGSRLR